MHPDTITLINPPDIPGLVFRRFRGEADYPLMAAAVAASADADKLERVTTVEDIAVMYSHLVNCDPYQDMIFAEVNGEVIGYSRGWWYEEANGPYLYGFIGFLVPEWRRKGIGTAILNWMERRLATLAEAHPPEREKFFQAGTDDNVAGFIALLEKSGYKPVRYAFEMIRPSLDDLPDFPLPEGIELRPVLPEHYLPIWEADIEAFSESWGFSRPSETDYEAWLENKTIFQPDLWQIAWDIETDQIAGQVRTFIYHALNEKFNRKRGLTEFISVRRPWRRRGLARALIVRSLQVQKEQGMTASELGVDSENVHGATRVYEDCGFQVKKRFAIYRKRLPSASVAG